MCGEHSSRLCHVVIGAVTGAIQSKGGFLRLPVVREASNPLSEMVFAAMEVSQRCIEPPAGGNMPTRGGTCVPASGTQAITMLSYKM